MVFNTDPTTTNCIGDPMFTFHPAEVNPADDVRKMIRMLNAVIVRNPRVVDDHDPICPAFTGVADLHDGPCGQLLVRLAERGVRPPWGDLGDGRHHLVW